MPDDDIQEELEEQDVLEEEEESPSTTSGPSVEDMAALRDQILAVKNQNQQLVQEFKTAVGRYQSISDKLESGRGDEEKLRKQFNEQVGAVETAFDTLLANLDESALEPSTRAQIAQVRQNAKVNAERTALDDRIAQLEAEIQALRNPQQQPENEVERLETEINNEIRSFGLDPEADFDWKEASQVLQREGIDGTRSWFRTKIREKVIEKSVAERRQVRKDSAGPGSPEPRGNAERNPLRDGTLDERVKALREMTSSRV